MMEVTRVIVIQLKPTKEQKIILRHLTYSASKLWNVANYNIKQGNIKLKELKSTLKENFWYKNLHSQSAQAVLEKLQIAWENCYKKHTKEPRFQPKDGHFPVRWKKQGFAIIDNKLRLSLSKQTKTYLKGKYSIESNYLWIDLPKNLSLGRVQEIEIKPHRIYGHTIIIIGAMSDGISSMDIGSKNNEKLHKIPFGRLYNLIKYKAEEIGIAVAKVDEAYTSQTCCKCGIVKKSNRKYRGLYVCSSCKTVINADVNGAVNILKRVAPNLNVDRSRGFLDNPVRVRIS